MASATTTDGLGDRFDAQARRIVEYASALAEARDLSRLHMEHLVFALYELGGKDVRLEFARAGFNRESLLRALHAFAVPTARVKVPDETRQLLSFSRHAQQALDKSAPDNGELVTPQDLLKGLRAVQSCKVIVALRGLRPAPAISMLNDDAVSNSEADLLKLEDFAVAIAGVLDNTSSGSLTIALSAPWGAGKTSLAQLIEERLHAKPAAGSDAWHITCWFNAWMHDSAKDLAGAFAATIARSVDAARPWYRRLFSPLPAALLTRRGRAIRRFILATPFLAVVVSVLVWWFKTGNPPDWFLGLVMKPGPTANNKEIDLATSAVALAALTAVPKLYEMWSAGAKAVGSFVSNPDATVSVGGMAEVADQLHGLIRQATTRGNRLVVFVDDLERCQPPRAVEVLEVVNQLLRGTNTVTVLLADLPAVAAAIQKKYEDLGGYDPDADQQSRRLTSTSLQYGWLYLQKIVQLRFELPTYTSSDIFGMLERLAGKDAEKPSNGKTPTEKPPASTRIWPWAPWPDAPVPGDAWRCVRSQKRGIRTLATASYAMGLPGVLVRRTVENAIYPCEQRRAVARRPFRPIVQRGIDASTVMVGTAYVGALAATTIWMGTLVEPLTNMWPGLRVMHSGVSSAVTTIDWLTMLIGAPVFTALLVGYVVARRLRNDRKRFADYREGRDAAHDVDDRHGLAALEQEQAFSAIDDSSMLLAAQSEAMKHLAPLPRNSKRLRNQLRLILYIGFQRRLWNDDAAVGARIGKWAAFRERWPELARLIVARPELMADLENVDRFKEVTSGIIPALSRDEELQAFLSDEPRLSSIIEQLVRFRMPAPLESRPPGAPNVPAESAM